MTFTAVLRRLGAACILATAFSAVARAGYYTVTYTTSSPSGVAGSPPAASASASQIGGTVAINSAVTATFTWHPNNDSDLPPDCAVLREHGWASYTCGTGTGRCDDGLGDSYSGGAYPTKRLERIRYSVVQFPAGHDTVTWSAPAVTPIGSATWAGKISANTFYSAELFAVWIDTSNTMNAKDDPDDEWGKIYAESGRATTSSLSTGLAGAFYTGVNWTVSGDTFTSYAPTATAATHVVGQSQSATFNTASPSWFYSNECESDISATGTFNSGDGSSLLVSATKHLVVEEPTFQGPVAYSGTTTAEMRMLSRFLNSNGDETKGVGMNVQPDDDACWCADHFPGGGVVASFQIANEHWTGLFGGWVPVDTAGVYALDNSVPLWGTYTFNESQNCPMSDSDNPNFTAPPAVAVQTQYELYIMYRPSTSFGSSWVPLARFHWSWNCGNDGSSTSPSGDPDTAYTTLFPEWDFTSYTDHPQN